MQFNRIGNFYELLLHLCFLNLSVDRPMYNILVNCPVSLSICESIFFQKNIELLEYDTDTIMSALVS